VLVSPISFFEIVQSVRLGKWPEMAPFVPNPPAVLERQGGGIAGLDQRICLRVAIMDWTHRDSFGRLLAATAEQCNVAIISTDTVFDGVVTRV
ncbi:MAG: type II toxin-antitoxin system VapC family toxin, partial [Acetobacteraceae bacterium]|nr:type II toxin-antitoxin system VapC family toxin [Acetobacteraceae bacterium]